MYASVFENVAKSVENEGPLACTLILTIFGHFLDFRKSDEKIAQK
jgi:hypothetical protein